MGVGVGVGGRDGVGVDVAVGVKVGVGVGVGVGGVSQAAKMNKIAIIPPKRMSFLTASISPPKRRCLII